MPWNPHQFLPCQWLFVSVWFHFQYICHNFIFLTVSVILQRLQKGSVGMRDQNNQVKTQNAINVPCTTPCATGIKTGKMRVADVSKELNSELLNEQGPQWKKVASIMSFSIGSGCRYSRALANITGRKSASPIIWVQRVFYRFHICVF